MSALGTAILFLFAVFVISVGIMFAVALGIIIAYEYMRKGGKDERHNTDDKKHS